jgi:hypothetical protein
VPTLEALLGRGYLPKELPTPFTSRSFAASVSTGGPRLLAGVRTPNLLTVHTLARPGMTGRVLAIPNPAHFYKLAANEREVNGVGSSFGR